MGCRGRKFWDCVKLAVGCFLGNAGLCTTYYAMARERTSGEKGKDQSRLRRNKQGRTEGKRG